MAESDFTFCQMLDEELPNFDIKIDWNTMNLWSCGDDEDNVKRGGDYDDVYNNNANDKHDAEFDDNDVDTDDDEADCDNNNNDFDR